MLLLSQKGPRIFLNTVIQQLKIMKSTNTWRIQNPKSAILAARAKSLQSHLTSSPQSCQV